MRTNILTLLERVAAEEAAFRETRFIAPCVAKGAVQVPVAGIVQTFTPMPSDFAGWGVFAPESLNRARVIEEADLPLVSAYLAAFPVLRVRLVQALAGQTWMAYPVSEADYRQRFVRAGEPLVVHLVTEGTTLDVATVRGVGGAWWFEDVDRRADPMPGERLRNALAAVTEPDDLRFPGLTPEMRTAYDLLTQSDDRFAVSRRERAERIAREAQADARRQTRAAAEAFQQDACGRRPQEPARPRRENDGRRLRTALAVGGGSLRDWSDRGDYWLVEWTTGGGDRHTSAIAKADLTVVSSGVCLSGRDRDFDLQSLVRVIEQGTW